jgi:PilZ domain
MLDHHSPEQAIAAWINSLPCDIRFPDNLKANFERTGPTTTVADDVRSSVRIRCCGHNHRAALQIRQTFRAFPRETAWNSVYTTNISKNGCGFCHSEMLYPGERLTMILLTGIQRSIEVVWCRRIAAHCFIVGSRFCKLSADDAQASQNCVAAAATEFRAEAGD